MQDSKVSSYRDDIASDGFAIINGVFTDDDIECILTIISKADPSELTFRKTDDLFAIGQFFKAVPEVVYPVFNAKFCSVVPRLLGDDFFVVKSIWFDKPESSNWFVSYHQDLTISVDRKIEAEGFHSWTIKQNQYAVQPPLKVLQDNVTIRIHLDKTNAENGALKVIAGSHTKGIYRPETIDWNTEQEVSCDVEKGGVMITKPLLLHSSGRTTNGQKRRVVHIEFSRTFLPAGLQWAEAMEIPGKSLQ